MQQRIFVPPLGKVARGADILMSPLMRLISGAPTEAPQRTHQWNNRKLRIEKTFDLDTGLTVRHPGIPSEGAKCGIRFHVPILNGWTKYIVLQPVEPGKIWHVGWITTDKQGYRCGVSRIPLLGAVRMLIGPEKVSFFGIEASRFTQIGLEEIGQDVIGSGGPYSQLSFL